MNRDTSPILINQGLSNAGFDINESTVSLDNDVDMDKDDFNRFEYRRFWVYARQIFRSDIFKKTALYSILLIILFCCFVTVKKVLIYLNI